MRTRNCPLDSVSLCSLVALMDFRPLHVASYCGSLGKIARFKCDRKAACYQYFTSAGCVCFSYGGGYWSRRKLTRRWWISLQAQGLNLFYSLFGCDSSLLAGYLLLSMMDASSYRTVPAPLACMTREPCVSYNHILLSNATVGMWCLRLGPCFKGTLTGVTTTSCFENHQQGRGAFGSGPRGQVYIHTAPAHDCQLLQPPRYPEQNGSRPVLSLNLGGHTRLCPTELYGTVGYLALS